MTRALSGSQHGAAWEMPGSATQHAGLTQLDLNACPLAVLESYAAQVSGRSSLICRCRAVRNSAWRAAISDEADVLHIRSRALIERNGAEPERALAYAHRCAGSPGTRTSRRKSSAGAGAQSAMTAQPPARALRRGGTTGRWELMRDRVATDRQQVLPLHRRAFARGRAPASHTPAVPTGASGQPDHTDDRNDLRSIDRQILQHRVRQDEQRAPRAPLGPPAPDARCH